MLLKRLGKIPLTLSNVVLVFFILSPLIYATDNDPYRGFEVIGVAAIGVAFILLHRTHGLRFWPESALLLLYGIVLVVQQLAIHDGSMPFGAQYAIHMALMFVPLWVLRGVPLSAEKFAKAVDFALSLVAFVTVLTLFASFFLGVGEVYTGEGLTRAFGWLGDSYTPVIVFLILYFYFQNQWLHVGALSCALIMTGGKAGLIMLVVLPFLYVLVSSESATKKFGIFCASVTGALLIYTYWDDIFLLFFQNYEYSYNTRALSIELGIDYFLENPWFGIGINQSMKLANYDSVTLISSLGGNSYPIYQIHNAFVRAAAETGIFGLTVLVVMCFIWIVRWLRILRQAYSWPVSQERSIAMAGTLWAICFILLYQSTGWFEVGHPQLAWLLIIMAMAETDYRRVVRAKSKVYNVDAHGLHNVQIEQPVGSGVR